MIRIDNLTKYYGDSCAVDDISFEINRGEILGLLGPNGGGERPIYFAPIIKNELINKEAGP